MPAQSDNVSGAPSRQDMRDLQSIDDELLAKFCYGHHRRNHHGLPGNGTGIYESRAAR